MTDNEDKKSISTTLVEMALDAYRFGVSSAGEPFATAKDGPEVVLPLRGGRTSLRAALAKEYFARAGRTAPQQALADALLVLEGHAQEADETVLHLRVAEHDGAIYLDLGDHTGRAVKIRNGEWVVTSNVPVRFRRTTLMSPLPEPIRMNGRSLLMLLGEWLNVRAEDWPIIVSWLVAAFFEDIPHPALTLVAEQGTGKTTATKVIVGLIDPSPVPCRKPPKDMDSWVTAAAGSWVVSLDNLSNLPDWLSDSLCRAVTGDGDVRRRLYTDGDYAVFAFRRCLIVNGIDLGAVRDDLADRMLPVSLAPIPADERRPESDLWPLWNQQHPKILGALLAVVAEVAEVLPSVRLESSPRMADFARIVAAVDQILGSSGLDRYLTRTSELAADLLTGEPFYLEIAASITEVFTGTTAELLTRVTPTSPDWRMPRTGWPRNGRAATGALRRLAPTMRKVGWDIREIGRDGHDKTIRWSITPPSDPAAEKPAGTYLSPEFDPQPPQHPQSAEVAEVAEVDPPTSTYVHTTPQPPRECQMCARPAGPDGFCDLDDRDHEFARRTLRVVVVPEAGQKACGHPGKPTANGKCGDCIADRMFAGRAS